MKKLVKWNNEKDCKTYYVGSGYIVSTFKQVKTAMLYGSRIKFRDDEHIKEFKECFDVVVY